jgi:aldose 1-epimerase
MGSPRMALKASSSEHGGPRAPALCAQATLMIWLSTTGLAQGAAESRFGTMPDGHTVEQYSLRNRAGSEATVMSLGATLQSLRLHDRDGHLIDVVLGYDSLAEYLNGGSYFGATIGRYANRIAHAEFSLDGKTYHLPANNGENTLHGGTAGFNRGLWNRVGPTSRNSIRLKYVSADGDQGFPGRLTVWVTYTLTDADELKISYQARTSAPTIVNLTNHSYFNLGGAGIGDVSQERITVQASSYTPVDAANIPTGDIESVGGTDFDFRTGKSLGEHLQSASDPAIVKSQVYDINLVLDGGARLRRVALVQDPRSGLSMEVSTTEPGVQLYAPNFTRGRLTGKGSQAYVGHGAICLETEHFPDSPHRPRFPSTVLRPGQTLRSETIYKFSTEAQNATGR